MSLNLDQLHQLSELKYHHSQQQLSKILKRETALRAKLTRLGGYVSEINSLPAEQAPMRAIGADLVWLRWITKTQASLNIELAQVLAEKEWHIDRHKLAFGKVQVSESLARTDKEKRARSIRDKALATIMEQALF
jgi:chaperonin cofactor prefoldin